MIFGQDDNPSVSVSRNTNETLNRAILNCAGGRAIVGDFNLYNNTRIEVNDSSQNISAFTPSFREVALNGGYVEHNLSSGADSVNYSIQPYLEGGVNPDNYELFIGHEDEPQVVIRKFEDYTLNELTLSCAGGKALLGF